eukprot:c9705_g1_i5.p1 GENE.c9705_g1_i5~~c9705_g1_i5.p1  ORF type:complete len:271 (+),score=57.76 c9705_g1_i5:939-1751(+)
MTLRLMRNVLCHERSCEWEGVVALTSHCERFFRSPKNLERMISLFVEFSRLCESDVKGCSHFHVLQLESPANFIPFVDPSTHTIRVFPGADRYSRMIHDLCPHIPPRVTIVEQNILLKYENSQSRLFDEKPETLAEFVLPHILFCDAEKCHGSRAVSVTFDASRSPQQFLDDVWGSLFSCSSQIDCESINDSIVLVLKFAGVSCDMEQLGYVCELVMAVVGALNNVYVIVVEPIIDVMHNSHRTCGAQQLLDILNSSNVDEHQSLHTHTH